MNRTVVENRRPTGSRMNGSVMKEVGSVIIFHSIMRVFIFTINHRVRGSIVRVAIQREFLVIFERLKDWGMT